MEDACSLPIRDVYLCTSLCPASGGRDAQIEAASQPARCSVEDVVAIGDTIMRLVVASEKEHLEGDDLLSAIDISAWLG